MRIVGVIGAGRATPEQREIARRVGELLARAGRALVCGGLGGVMEAACEGASAAGGLTIGYLPGLDPRDANPYVTLALPTGLGEGRNLLIVRAAEVLIAIGGEYGTLSEIAFALKAGKRVIGIRTWEIPGIEWAESPEEAVRLAVED